MSYAIGVARPTSVSIETFGTAHVAEETIVRLVDEHFDLRPGAIIEALGLLRPIYRQTAAFGHFGRTDVDLPWEEHGDGGRAARGGRDSEDSRRGRANRRRRRAVSAPAPNSRSTAACQRASRSAERTVSRT